MIRKIIQIDEEKCDGCGLCAMACHEGAIDIIDGKAKLVREHYCDGLGDCLPNCPRGAIRFEEREAPEYDEEAVKKTQEENRIIAQKMSLEDIIKIEDDNERRKIMMAKMKEDGAEPMHNHGNEEGCPGSKMMEFHREESIAPRAMQGPLASISRLAQWPCQIKLVPTEAPFFNGVKLLIAADCSAYAYANMHEDFMRGKTTLIGCPKLDDIDYSEKLTEIIKNNDIREVTIVRMEVPCCGGLENMAKKALQASGKFLPWHVVTITRDGHILD